MNKTIIININSIVFHIEEDAYETLRSYMIDIKRHFGKSEDSKEILEDIENRIAEMFSERIHSGRKEVINMEDVNLVISQMGRVSDFEDVTGSNTNITENDTEAPIEHSPLPEPEYFSKRLMRDPDDKVFGGVCSGLGHYFGMESKWIRVIFLLFFLFAGSGVFLYIVLWMVIPTATSRADKMAMRGEAPNLQNFKKSFEKEMEGFQANFSGAGEHISRGARSAGDFLASIVRGFVKFMGFILLISTGLTIIGLFIAFVVHILYFMGMDNIDVAPAIQIMSTGSAFFATLAVFLAITIPFLAAFYLLLRALFKIQPMNNFASLTLFTTWVLSIIAILYFVVTTHQDFKETSTIKVEKKIEAKAHYVIAEKDVRVINASDEDFSNKRIKVSTNSLKDLLRKDVRIKIEALDSLEQPFVQYHYSAKGRTFKEASDRASEIGYTMTQEDRSLIFDSHFSLQDKQLYRDQEVEVVVFLPVGTKVTIMNNMDYKVRRSVWIHDCYPDINNKSTEWIMTRNGLKCATVKEEEKKQDEPATFGEEVAS